MSQFRLIMEKVKKKPLPYIGGGLAVIVVILALTQRREADEQIAFRGYPQAPLPGITGAISPNIPGVGMGINGFDVGQLIWQAEDMRIARDEMLFAEIERLGQRIIIEREQTGIPAVIQPTPQPQRQLPFVPTDIVAPPPVRQAEVIRVNNIQAEIPVWTPEEARAVFERERAQPGFIQEITRPATIVQPVKPTPTPVRPTPTPVRPTPTPVRQPVRDAGLIRRLEADIARVEAGRRDPTFVRRLEAQVGGTLEGYLASQRQRLVAARG